MAARRRTRSSSKILTISVLVVVLLLAALPTAMVLAVGLAPTLVALIVDTTPGRYLMRCVAGLNLAGILPFLHKLWLGGHSMGAAFSIVSDLYAWLVIYSAAAIGWLLFLGVPGAVAVFRQLNARRRIYILREQQRMLLAEWGDAILPPGETRRPAAGAGSGNGKDGAPAPSGAESAMERELARRAAQPRGG